MEVANTNHETEMSQKNFGLSDHLDMLRRFVKSSCQVRNKPVCVALMEFNPWQDTGKVRIMEYGPYRYILTSINQSHLFQATVAHMTDRQ